MGHTIASECIYSIIKRKRNNTFVSILQALGMLMMFSSLFGCVSPIVVDNHFAGMGLFRSNTQKITPGAVQHKNEGFGLYTTQNRIGFGWIDQDILVIAPTHVGIHIDTSFGEVATGQRAEQVAHQQGMLGFNAESAWGLWGSCISDQWRSIKDTEGYTCIHQRSNSKQSQSAPCSQ